MEEPAGENMFRCPTCISVLGDPTSRRCTQCGQRLRRKGPKVLGEEQRIGAGRLLPIERAMHERLHGHAGQGRRSSRHQPPPWVDRYQLTARSAAAIAAEHGDTVHGSGGIDTLEPPRPKSRRAAPAPAAPAPPPMPEFEMEPEHSALDVQSYLANFEPPTASAADTIVFDDEPVVFDAPEFRIDFEEAVEVDVFAPLLGSEPQIAIEPDADYALDPGPLDPEVQALVDDLYRKARAEIVGTFESPVHIEPIVDPGEGLAPAEEVYDERLPSGPRRRGWVPAVLADRKKNDPGNGKSGGWRRLD